MRRHAQPETDTETLRPPSGGGPRKIDRYEIKELLGRGGMGAVYRALDTKLGRSVALKTAVGKRAGARLTDRVRQRFLREAMALSRVEHRNVVQVLDFGFADDGTPFLVMEHLKGRDLGVVLAEAAAPLPVREAVDIMLGVCAALRACHRVGIIHRDLKPGNIFLAETDTGTEVKVLDFGVSKAPTSDDLTREGQILGTPQFLAPEQIDGKVGPASDQYALGVLLYACLTLRLPYEDLHDRGLLRAIETGQFAAPSNFRGDLPEALEAIVLRAMHVSPGERFESVYALGQRLWELASPRAQEEWRSYYRPEPRPASAPAGAMLAKTEILPPSRDDAAEDGDRRRPSTMTAWANAAAPSGTSASAPLSGDLSIPRSPRRWIAAALLLLAVGGWSWARAHRARRRPPPVRTVPAQQPERTRPAAPEQPAARPIAPPLPPAPQARARPAAPPPRYRPAPPHRPAPSHRPPPRQAPFAPALPNIDAAGIGIPST
ncbi:MAG TPA: serine/threonine-protein kinase [Polyangia bacterium]|nr:serine/threonine-protein kinase [Polyangia bacterium]